MKIFYFTATGNSLAVAKEIGGELISIAQVLKSGEKEFNDEAIGFVFPCYAFSMPYPVKKLLETVSFKADYFFAVITYGNILGGTIKAFKKAAAKQNINLSYAASILMTDNYLPFYEMKKQQQILAEKKVEDNLKRIASEIESRKNAIESNNFFANFASSIFTTFNLMKPGKFDKAFYVQDSCNQCKVCQKVCPMNNIEINEKPEFKQNCVSCLACTHNCPENAIRMKSEKSKERYRNSSIQLADIISANNQL